MEVFELAALLESNTAALGALLPERYIEAVRRYQYSAAQFFTPPHDWDGAVNLFLRSGSDPSVLTTAQQEVIGWVDDLLHAVLLSEAPCEFVVYRGVREVESFLGCACVNVNAGRFWVEQGILSTSIEESIALGFATRPPATDSAVVVIPVQEKEPALWIGSLGHPLMVSSEKEVLIPPTITLSVQNITFSAASNGHHLVCSTQRVM
jgi:hypothetical protein